MLAEPPARRRRAAQQRAWQFPSKEAHRFDSLITGFTARLSRIAQGGALMSKVTVLGGCGAIGSVAVRTLTAGDDFSEIVVAEKRTELACELAEQLDPSRISVLEVDADDPESIKRAVAGSSVALNCIGPFYKYGPPILQAVIEAGVNYVDVCDDLDATVNELALDEAARRAGVSALIGMGNSPGLANLLVRFCADHLLAQVDVVDIYHIHGGEPVEGAAVINHRFHAMESEIPVFLDGKFTQVKMLEDSGKALMEETEFKDIGTYPVYPYPHAETITLPKYLKGVRRVANLGSVLPISYFKLTMDMIRLGFGSAEPLLVQGCRVIPREFAVSFLLAQRERLLKETGITGPRGCLKVKVQGRKDGEPHTCVFSMSSRTGGVRVGTGIPAALGAVLMNRGLITMKGTFPPEAAVDPLQMLRLADRAVQRFGMGAGLPITVEHIDTQGNRTSGELKR
jgi:saccharopine dehydrogenase (NAD+, L-lysine-forming)